DQDAIDGAAILGITLTARNNGAAAKVSLAGVPAEALPEYLEKLVRAGRKVAILEQVEDPAAAKGLVRREVTEVVTPGVLLQDALLDGGRANYVAAVYAVDGKVGLAAADVSTGEVLLSGPIA